MRKHPQYRRALLFGNEMKKVSTSIDEQIRLLTSRGLIVENSEHSQLQQFLTDSNYYRISGYWKYFQVAPQHGENDFIPGTSFQDVRKIYTLDNELRRELFNGLSEFEIVLRSRFAYNWTKHQGSTSYLIPESYALPKVIGNSNPGASPAALAGEIRRELTRSKENFIKMKLEFNQDPEIWAGIEALSMGTVSKMFESCIYREITMETARSFNFPNLKIASSTFRSLTILRNICAHHGRLWNRVPEFPNPVLRNLKVEKDLAIYHRTAWAWVTTLSYQVDLIRGSDTYSKSIISLVESNPEFLRGLKYPKLLT